MKGTSRRAGALRVAGLLVVCGFASGAIAQSELQNYVGECQKQLGFNAGDIQAMNSNEGPRFLNGAPTPISDFLVHRRVNDSVDALVACRWGDDFGIPAKNTRFASMEMLITNRINQQTCFFVAQDRPLVTKDKDRPITSAIISPTYFGAHPNADDFWISPSELNARTLLSDHNVSADPNTVPVQSMRRVIRASLSLRRSRTGTRPSPPTSTVVVRTPATRMPATRI
jgi:hypothetical protein